jgi:hypothetical protein
MPDHKLYPHGPLEPLAPNLWLVRGSMSFPLRRNMVVYRLSDGTLLLYSVVAMDEAGLKSLEALGRPALMVIPHENHCMDAAFYKTRYPDLKVACPAAGKKRVEGRGVKVDGTPEEILGPRGIQVHPVTGMGRGEFAMEVEIPGGKALVSNDLLGGPTPGEKLSWMVRLSGPPRGPRLGVARIVRWVMVKDKIAVRAWLNLMAENPAIKVITASHAPPITDDCQQTLREAATTL